MPQKIKIRVVGTFKKEDIYTKQASIKIGSREYIPLFPAINPRRVRYNTIRNMRQPIPIENYIVLKLEALRAMDSDQDKQKAFIAEKLENTSAAITLFITKLLVKPTQKILDKDVDYLVDLLNFPSNDIMVPPLIYDYVTTQSSTIFPNGKDIPTKGADPDSYITFLKLFLQKAAQRNIESFAMMIPNNFSHTDIEKLLSTYKDYDTQIAVIDAKGSKISQLSPQISKLISFDPNLYTLPQKNKDAFALYAFDSVPYTAHQRDLAPAENVLQYFSGFSWFGPRHTVNIRFNTPLPPHPPRLYNSDEYAYIKHTSKTYAQEKKSFDDWFKAVYATAPTPKDKLNSYKKDYEIVGLARSVDALYGNISNDKFFSTILSKPHLSDVVKRIKSMNKNDLKL
ncbi:MAG: hypothetical protein QXN16_02410 [Candidatus Micrarchaeaceae archaeon]